MKEVAEKMACGRQKAWKKEADRREKREKRIEKKEENHKSNYVAPSMFVTL